MGTNAHEYAVAKIGGGRFYHLACAGHAVCDPNGKTSTNGFEALPLRVILNSKQGCDKCVNPLQELARRKVIDLNEGRQSLRPFPAASTPSIEERTTDIVNTVSGLFSSVLSAVVGPSGGAKAKKDALVLYHGSRRRFATFDINPLLAVHEETTLVEGYGIYMTDKQAITKGYGNLLYTVHVPKSHIFDATNAQEVRTLIRAIGTQVNLPLERLINVSGLVDGVKWGHYSITGMGKEIRDLLDSEESFYERYGHLVTHDDGCLFNRLEMAFRSTLKPVIKYYDSNFSGPIYICWKDPDCLHIASMAEN